MATSKKRKRLDFSDITILVGEEQKKFTVHATYITSSKFLTKCCDGPWVEAQTKTIRLSEMDSETFAIYLQWLYTGELLIVEDEENAIFKGDRAEVKARPETAEYFSNILKLAVLGDQLDDSSFRNKIIDLTMIFMYRLAAWPDARAISWAFENLPESSLFRKFLVDLTVTCCHEETFRRVKDYLTADFISEVATKLMGARPAGENGRSAGMKLVTPSWDNRCDYHEHGANESRCVDI